MLFEKSSSPLAEALFDHSGQHQGGQTLPSDRRMLQEKLETVFDKTIYFFSFESLGAVSILDHALDQICCFRFFQCAPPLVTELQKGWAKSSALPAESHHFLTGGRGGI